LERSYSLSNAISESQGSIWNDPYFLEAPFYKAGGREQRLPLGMAAL
jgi:hypothetical protein